MTPKQRVLKKCPRAYLQKTRGGLCKVFQGGVGYNDWLATEDTPQKAWAKAHYVLQGGRKR